jgi:hypothetical protein
MTEVRGGYVQHAAESEEFDLVATSGSRISWKKPFKTLTMPGYTGIGSILYQMAEAKGGT